MDTNRRIFLTASGAVLLSVSTGGLRVARTLEARSAKCWTRLAACSPESDRIRVVLGTASPALNEYPEMTELFGLMHRTLVPPGSRVQMLSRLGYAAQIPPAPRWRVETRILNT